MTPPAGGPACNRIPTGETLVVDTIGLSTKAFVDNYRTPHSERLHVIERFQMIEGGKTMEVKVRVEDSSAFTTAWDVSQRYVRSEVQPVQERTCTENNANYFNLEIESTPLAEKPDF